MTLLDVRDLGVSWRKHPPIHELVAAYLLGSDGASQTATAPSREDLEGLVKTFGRVG